MNVAVQPETARRSTLDRGLAMRLAATEYDRFHHQLESLEPADWITATECAGWDVRAMAGHVLGMAEMAASVRQTIHQMRAAKRRGGVMIDALTAVQVDEQAHLSTEELMSRFGRVGPKAARARSRTPGFVRAREMPDPQLVGEVPEQWTFGFLLDVILTRDVWLHRIDIARATASPLELSPDHDGAIVADVIEEWASRHGEPFRLELTGPAGGTWAGPGDPVTADAVDFCRALSGRGTVQGTKGVSVPF